MPKLVTIVHDFAAALKTVDTFRPQAVNQRSGKPYQPGIGPHSESQTVELVAARLKILQPNKYASRIYTHVPYPNIARQKCDFCIGTPDAWSWAIEVKMLRMLGDNGKNNDNLLMHILSPYPQHRSALTDCSKLLSSTLGRNKAILIYGYEAIKWPLEFAISAFERLARTKAKLGPRYKSIFSGLIHPVYSSGAVFAWKIWPRNGGKS